MDPLLYPELIGRAVPSIRPFVEGGLGAGVPTAAEVAGIGGGVGTEIGDLATGGAEAALGAAGGIGGGLAFPGLFGLSGLLGNALGGLVGNPVDVPDFSGTPGGRAVAKYEALGGPAGVTAGGIPTGVPMVGGTPSRSGGAIDSAAVTNFINSALGISPAGAADYPQVNLPEMAGPRGAVDVTRVGVPSTGRIDQPNLLPTYGRELDAATRAAQAVDTGGGATTRGGGDASTWQPAFDRILQSIGGLPRGGGALGTGGAPTGTSAAAVANANPNDPIVNNASQRSVTPAGTPGTSAAGVINNNALTTPPKSAGALNDFWKEWGPWLGAGVGVGGLAYGLSKQKAAQSDQQATAGLLNRVTSGIQSNVVDPTGTALADNSLLAKSGLASSQDIERSKGLLDIMNTGKLPAGMQTLFDLALSDANANSRSKLANMGIGNSTMMADIENANRLRNLGEQSKTYEDLYGLGLKTEKQGYDITSDMIRNLLSGTSGQTGALTQAGGIYNQIAKDQIQADKDLVDALAKYANVLNKATAQSGATA